MMATKLVGGRLKAFSGLATKEDFFIFGFPKKKIVTMITERSHKNVPALVTGPPRGIDN